MEGPRANGVDDVDSMRRGTWRVGTQKPVRIDEPGNHVPPGSGVVAPASHLLRKGWSQQRTKGSGSRAFLANDTQEYETADINSAEAVVEGVAHHHA